jgi:hypothetical protein
MQPGQRLAARIRLAAVALFGLIALGGCSTPASLVTCLLPSGCVSLEVAKHVHQKLTEGDPVPCFALNSVERALSERCAPFEPRSLKAADVARPGLPVCPLTLAARDPQFWPVLAELLDRGAQPEQCAQPPLAALAQANPCPDFAAATARERDALRWLAEADARSVHHDVMRMLSCPNARAAKLDTVLDAWAAQGALLAGQLAFSPLAALHPSHLASPLARTLEGQGHTAQAALGGYEGRLPHGFEEALRTTEWQALDWWLARVPALVDRVPPTRANQLPWIPLAQVLTPSFMPEAERQREAVAYLLARGADPWKRLPHDPSRTVVDHARELRSPWLAELDPILRPPPGPLATARLGGVPAAAR